MAYKTLVYKYQHLYLGPREEAWVIAHIYNDGGATFKDHGTINYVSKGKWGQHTECQSRHHGGLEGSFCTGILDAISFSYRGVEGMPRFLKLVGHDGFQKYDCYHEVNGRWVLWAKMERVPRAESCEEWLEEKAKLPHVSEQVLIREEEAKFDADVPVPPPPAKKPRTSSQCSGCPAGTFAAPR